MKKLLVLLFSTAGSAAGWWIGARVGGIMTAFVLSMIGLGVGMWWGARLAARVGQQPMPKPRALTLGFSLLACAVPAQAQERPTLTCPEDVANVRTPTLTQPNPGEYRLTMVATRGSRRGESRTGPLHLEKSRAVDGKRITFRNEVLPDTAEHPLIGHTSVDLLGVGAPMARSNDAVEPSWTSRDKTHPGVLVLVARRYGTDSISAVDLLIGTVSNHRDGSNWLDGAGIHLSVNEISDSTFAGHWGAWGIIHDGSGYFCARRVGPAALTEERPRSP